MTRRVYGHDRERHDHRRRRAESVPSSDSIQARPEPGATTRTDCSGAGRCAARDGHRHAELTGSDRRASAARASPPDWRPVVLLGGAVGFAVYALDGLIFLAVRNWIGLGFHVFVLVMVFKGLQAAHQLDAGRT